MRLADLVRRRELLLKLVRRDQALDPLLHRVGQLEPVGAEEFDPIVLIGVVTGGDHHPRIAAHIDGEKSQRGRRHRADLHHLDTHRIDARGERVLEHVSGQACVLGDQDLWAAPHARSEHVGDCLSQRQRDVGRHGVHVRRAPDSVRTEELHRTTPYPLKKSVPLADHHSPAAARVSLRARRRSSP